jgi:hypothetical protein
MDPAVSTVTSYPHIVKQPGSPAHLEAHHLGRGLGPEDLVRHYPYLTLAEVHAAMAYYHDHQGEIDSEIQEELNQLQDSREANLRSAIWQKLKAKGVI